MNKWNVPYRKFSTKCKIVSLAWCYLSQELLFYLVKVYVVFEVVWRLWWFEWYAICEVKRLALKLKKKCTQAA